MRLGGPRYTAQQRLQLTEGAQRHVRGIGEAHADASLTLGHPFGHDDELSGRRDADEAPVAGGASMGPRDRQRLAAEGVPWIVDDDRS